MSSPCGSQLAQQVKPIAVRQAEIEDRQRRALGGHQLPAGPRRVGLQRVVAVGGQVVGEKAARWEVVLYDQDLRRWTIGRASQEQEAMRAYRRYRFPPCKITFRLPPEKDSHI